MKRRGIDEKNIIVFVLLNILCILWRSQLEAITNVNLFVNFLVNNVSEISMTEAERMVSKIGLVW